MRPYEIIALAIVVALSSTTHAQDSVSPHSRVIELSPDSSLVLGSGVTSLNGEAKGECVTYAPIRVVEYSGQLVSYQARLVTSRQEFQEFIEASVSVQASSIAGMNASASAKFSNQTSINSYDVNYIAKVTVQNQGRTLQTVLLKPEVIARISSEVDPLAWFLQTCGDSYVAKIVSGGELIANLSLVTKSTQDTTNFSAQLRGSTLTFAASGDFSKVVSKLQDDSSLSISLFRTGGLGLELPGSLDALTAQVRTFPSQLTDRGGAPLRAITQSFTTVQNLPNVIRVPLNQNLQSLRALVDTYNQVRDEIDRVNYITANQSQFYLDPFDIPELATEIPKLRGLIGMIQERVTRCVQRNDGCHDPVPSVPAGRIYPGRR